MCAGAKRDTYHTVIILQPNRNNLTRIVQLSIEPVMRLKLLTNLNTLLLVTVCVALAVTLWWSQRALQQPVQLMERYLTLSQQFQRDVAANVLAYLGSGDALRHSAASEMVNAGVDLYTVGQVLGHRDSRIARLTITEVQEQLAFARIAERQAPLEKNHRVIARKD